MRWQMKKLTSLYILGVFLIAPAKAAQIIEVLPDQEIQAFVAQHDLSRIKVTNDRIRAVRANEGEIEVADDPILGEVYVAVKTPNPISIFITTEKNDTYKLLLISKKVPSEQIFLVPKGTQQKDKNSNFDETKLIKAMIRESDIDGFRISRISSNIELFGISFKQLAEYKGKTITGYVLEVDEDFDVSTIENRELQALSLSESTGGYKRLYLVLENGDE